MDYKKAVVDRIEENKAVCELEDRQTMDVDTDFFNYPVKAGDHVKIYKTYAEKDETRVEQPINLDHYFKD